MYSTSSIINVTPSNHQAATGLETFARLLAPVIAPLLGITGPIPSRSSEDLSHAAVNSMLAGMTATDPTPRDEATAITTPETSASQAYSLWYSCFDVSLISLKEKTTTEAEEMPTTVSRHFSLQKCLHDRQQCWPLPRLNFYDGYGRK